MFYAVYRPWKRKEREGEGGRFFSTSCTGFVTPEPAHDLRACSYVALIQFARTYALIYSSWGATH